MTDPLTIQLKEASFPQESPLNGHILIQAGQGVVLSGIHIQLEKVFPGQAPQPIGQWEAHPALRLKTGDAHSQSFSIDFPQPANELFDIFGMQGSLKTRTESLGATLGHIASEFYLQVEVKGEVGGKGFVQEARLFARIV